MRKLSIVDVLKMTAIAVLYFFLVYAGYFIGYLLGDPGLWNRIDTLVTITGRSFSLFSAIHVLIGAPVFLHASFHLFRIMELVPTEKQRKAGTALLLTDGYYGKVRHPMYGMMILQAFGYFFSLRSIFAILIALVFMVVHIYSGWIEEKTYIRQMFGEKYDEYRKLVPVAYLSPLSTGLVIFLIVFCIIGLFF